MSTEGGTTNRRSNNRKVEAEAGQDAPGSAGRSLAEDAAGGDVWRGETDLPTHPDTLRCVRGLSVGLAAVRQVL